MRTLILTLVMLIAAPSLAQAHFPFKKAPGDLPKPHALKKGVDPQKGPKVKKHKLFHHKG
jgi:hypothetical protein